MHEGYMFSLLVQKQLELWPEKNIRKRRWVCLNLSFTNIDQLDFTLELREQELIFTVSKFQVSVKEVCHNPNTMGQ